MHVEDCNFGECIDDGWKFMTALTLLLADADVFRRHIERLGTAEDASNASILHLGCAPPI